MSGAIETAAAAPAPRAAEALQRDNAHGHFETKAGVEISTEQAPATMRKMQQQPNDARHVHGTMPQCIGATVEASQLVATPQF